MASVQSQRKKKGRLNSTYKSLGGPSNPSPTPEVEKKAEKEDRTLSRNIDEVVFADHSFKTWYPSWYPKEILGEKALALAEEGKGTGIVVKTLYICRKCFKYSMDGVEWKTHQDLCEKNNDPPGQEIYVKNRGKGEEAGEGRWTVWEVDGAVDKLFCQNLSLFAKLFLDNKSVFFDVEAFKYFLYVHTNLESGDKQIIGFFSKEKMSWDNNNLACILIFPPWQKKGLGSNLIGISYSIARRERIMGGPEKPISDLGRKSYKRYWGAVIGRWLLNNFEEENKNYSKKKGMPTINVSIISKETWIHADDVQYMLREMNFVKLIGKGPACEMDINGVEEWLAKNKVSIAQVVDEDGFLPGYAEKKTSEEREPN
ncbi:acyl-CoA N-acyltransferase [Mollisia scopiformis]|uniref:histone acetyltransferase n=1 Tax=Mollisia scopiformis TaxID=149040 RepID=A0A194X3X5_MOLSC|nr:acyl-CoA N-acyltransferase [Mollisia scopiformis]KUJ14893.1 acyl-CoA N-acyltransferase [Mollisia scopiformis]